ncbi:TetR/AcrR family transcriptional regulator [Virgibacillus pantothenticus]|uniref:TetR/AcrR family transcriptional regulator n=1 Tax=Virgibacillus TaxID=84406 RepID=UPI00067A8418|nr:MULTISPECIES: TetR/AcrR family transcriptional regulator [Virgibacillus]API91413.1 hypothetical protein BKP57_05885 [Virgibacillus sp. 6R]MBS7426660.1 TetR/AcrR family transcriptional regulator [Virgibacillus sp. 19R1-5]MBU8568480.1 TetR/AcrR family transcriptional regulator [Virgibacillus pantothenticus]MBU8599912.1 TetR/AcrR family transcriptional regulator [Virgibacillus pantothenticus]MBU8636646.1 TetR/AcrR family transcriptional regulator [Virgibacillus pantothenticus]
MRTVKKPEERLKELIELAKELFLEKGYEKVTVREILNKTESSGGPGLFYHYFKSKKEIYEAVINQMAEETILKRKKIFQEMDNSDESVLLTISKLLIMIRNDTLEYQKLQLKGENKQLLESASKKIIKSEKTMIKTLLYQLLERRIVPESPIFNNDSCDFLANFIIYGANGILANLEPDQDRIEATEYIKKVIEKLTYLQL